MEAALEEVLNKYFGYTKYRDGQREIIEALLSHRDVLAIMPTGAGKSLCYQIPSMIMSGLGIVVSPLISLMKDQVASLIEADIPAAFLNSSLSYPDYQNTVQRTLQGEFKILYIAPERLLNEDIFRIANTIQISLLIIDEAHCVSQWGHDFRPSYLHIRDFIERLTYKPVLGAFTATATENVRRDIASILKLDNPYCMTTGFDRANLYFEVQRLDTASEKTKALLNYIRSNKSKSGIVYCATRKTVEEVCYVLCANGIEATRYHAGLDDMERQQNQDDFIYDRKPIIAATAALGMGIDKSNVSFVIHYNMPKNIESYYQEAGRAGRDGEPADCILFYSAQDVHTNKYLIERADNASDDVTYATIQKMKKHNLELLKHMTFYSTTSDCLRGFVLKYFGDTAPTYCGHCSNCLSKFETVDITIEAKKIVSCVYRIEQRGIEKRAALNFGKTMIVDILHGSKNQKVLDAGFDTLSTYGIMADTSTARIRRILEYLIETDYLMLNGTEYPTVARSTKSSDIIKSGSDFKIEIKLPKTEEQIAIRNVIHLEEEAGLDLDLLAILKDLRIRLAAAAKVPAYIVFSDAALKDMCVKKPQTRDAFLNVSGVGNRKLEQYGDVFTSAIRDYLKA
ncbi:MAG: DNA helicase RecQ [Termitinemataceae bacterium]|nr:MAG: DNA helicase RecQ [Termitinemataceae bacterium]